MPSRRGSDHAESPLVGSVTTTPASPHRAMRLLSRRAPRGAGRNAALRPAPRPTPRRLAAPAAGPWSSHHRAAAAACCHPTGVEWAARPQASGQLAAMSTQATRHAAQRAEPAVLGADGVQIDTERLYAAASPRTPASSGGYMSTMTKEVRTRYGCARVQRRCCRRASTRRQLAR